MTRISNAAGILLALCASIAGPWWYRDARGVERDVAARVAPARDSVVERLPGGAAAVRDAGGDLIPVRGYRRIASASTVSDGLLLELVAPTRIVAFTEHGAKRAWNAHRYAGKSSIRALDDLEALLALKPDLVVVSSPGSFSKLERLRDAGLEVFDLGSQSGLDSLVPAALRLGAVLGVQARAEQLMKAFRGRLERLAKGVEPPRRSAAYVASYAGKLLSAGRGTSYHDVLQHAGLVDVVSGVFSGYPELSAEQLLDLDPDLIVSPTGAGEVLCRRPGLARLRACSRAGAVIEIDGALLGDTGLGMLEAAERVHAAAYPDGDSPAQ